MGVGTATAIAGGLQAAGSIAGALGGGKSQETGRQISGFESLPREVQDYLTGSIFGRIKSYGETPFPTVPYRRADDREADPIFGSRAIRDLQALMDYQNQMKGAQPVQQSAPQQDAATINSLKAQMQAQDYLSRQRSGYAPGTDMQRMHNQPMNMDALGEALSDYEKRFNFANPSLENLLTLTSPELRSRIYG